MERTYRRVIGTWTMLLCSVSSIIGSGWLFSSYYSSQIAGPAAIVSWLIAAVMTVIIAFTFAEISTLLAIPGGSSHFPHLTHGSLVSIVLSWISWLSIAVMPAIEVQAILQYASFFFPHLLSGGINDSLSPLGFTIAAIMMILFSIINIYSLRWVIRFNNAITIWKVIVPIIAAIALLLWAFHPHNFTAFGGFMPMGWHGVLAAIATGGIIFAFTGFKTVVEMAGEAHNPRRTVPFALIGSIIVCLIVYLLLQIAFLGAVPASSLKYGWEGLNFTGSASPLITLLAATGSVFILAILYINTVVAPMGAGLIYLTSSARVLQAMSANHQVPQFISLVNEHGIPVRAILINLVVSFVFFFPFPGWKEMVAFISSLMAFSYALGPICLLVLRYQLPEQARLFRIPYVHVWSFFAFFICTLMCYWTGWTVISKLALFLIGCMVFSAGYRLVSARAREHAIQFKPSIWIWFYFAGLTLISYLGTFGNGRGILHFGPDFLAIGLLSLITLFLAVRWRGNDAWVKEKCERLAKTGHTFNQET